VSKQAGPDLVTRRVNLFGAWQPFTGLAFILLSVSLASPSWGRSRKSLAQRATLQTVFQAGVDAYRLGQYAEAAVHLHKASLLAPTLPGPHRFLAAVAKATKRWQSCIDESQLALRLNPASTEAADTRALHEDCRKSSSKPSFTGDYGEGGALAVTCNVVDATVKVRDLAYGATPLLPRAVMAGDVVIQVSKPGWRTSEVKAVIVEGIVTDIDVTLVQAENK
jgi:PEGA domain